MDADLQRKQLVQIVLEEDLDLADVWLRYFAIGGSANEEEFALYAIEEFDLSWLQRDLASMALRELIVERQEALGLPATRERPRRPSNHGD